MLATMLAMAAICGPAGATTLARSDVGRVFVSRGSARGCVRSRSGSWRLGDASRVLEARVAGRYALVRRPGEVLSVYDLRERRRTASAGSFSGSVRFTAIRFHRSGVAAYASQDPSGRVEINTTDGAWGAEGADIDPGFVGLAGSVLAWRRAGGIEMQDEGLELAPFAQTVLRGRITIEVDHYSELRAHLGNRRPVALGDAATPCISSSGCSGVNRIQIAGDHVAARDWQADPVASQYAGAVTVADLRGRTRRVTCRSQEVHEYVVTEEGAVACLIDAGEPPSSTQEVRSENAVLDSGTGISALRRLGGEIVWRHDGIERTAPLPRRG